MLNWLASAARRLWSLFFIVVIVGGVTTVALQALRRWTSTDITTHALDEQVRGVLFGALVGAASLLLAVMLGVLAIVTTLDDRPIMVRWKKQPKSYVRLVDALLGPVFTTLVMAALSIVCIAIPDSAAGRDSIAFVVALTIGLGVAAFFQAAYVGYLLSRILLATKPGAAAQPVSPSAVDPDEIAQPLSPPAPTSAARTAHRSFQQSG